LQCRYYPNVNPGDETPGEWGRWISIALNITESERLKTEPEDLGISHAQKWEPKETKAAQASRLSRTVDTGVSAESDVRVQLKGVKPHGWTAQSTGVPASGWRGAAPSLFLFHSPVASASFFDGSLRIDVLLPPR
jgi:hypothetical protein